MKAIDKNFRSKRKCINPYILAAVSLVLVWTLVYSIFYHDEANDNDKQQAFSSPPQKRDYLIQQPHCFIQRTPAKRPNEIDSNFEDCSDHEDFTEMNGDVLQVKVDSLTTSCCVKEIYRPAYDSQDSFRESSKCIPLKDGKLNISSLEFMVVACQKSDGNIIEDYHANIPLQKIPFKSKISYWSDIKADPPPSVFVLVIDSASRAHTYGSLPKTVDLLVNKLNFVDFKGHHPSGEPTRLNVIPMLMGMKLNEFIVKYNRHLQDYWDDMPFIWNEFSRLNYITGYFEDIPQVGTFNYGHQNGFFKQSVDLYLRPLMLRYFQKHQYMKRQPTRFCLGKNNILRFMLNYHLRALKVLKKTPSFLVSWPTWPWHDISAALQLEDDTFFSFFQSIANDKNLLENTWLIVTADHGFYTDPYDYTPAGLLERRILPMFIRPPDRIINSQPELMKTLNSNAETITGHFDLYSTLVDLARHVDSNIQLPKMGHSLLKKLAASRTCEEVGIPDTMCACNRSLPEGDLALDNVLDIDNNQFLYEFIAN